MLSDQQLQEIRDRADKAIQGPWTATTWDTDTYQAESGDVLNGPKVYFDCPLNEVSYVAVCNGLGISISQDNLNATFIAHSREDIPALLDHISELENIILGDLPDDSPRVNFLIRKGIHKAIKIILDPDIPGYRGARWGRQDVGEWLGQVAPLRENELHNDEVRTAIELIRDISDLSVGDFDARDRIISRLEEKLK